MAKKKLKALTVDQIEALVDRKPKTKTDALNKLHKLLGHKNNWIKGTEEDNEGGLCLIGGIAKVNSKFEDAVTTAIKIAIVQLFSDRVTAKDAADPALISLDVSNSNTLDNIIDQIDEDSDDMLQNVEISDFNDHNDTTHKDVLKVIARAKKIKAAILQQRDLRKEVQLALDPIQKQMDALLDKRTKMLEKIGFNTYG